MLSLSTKNSHTLDFSSPNYSHTSITTSSDPSAIHRQQTIRSIEKADSEQDNFVSLTEKESLELETFPCYFTLKD